MKSVRVRTTAAAVVVVGVALVGGAIALVVTLRHTLIDEVRNAAELLADDLVELLEAGTEPSGLRLGGDDDTVVTSWIRRDDRRRERPAAMRTTPGACCS